MKTLVLGLGNPILTDDGVGIHAVHLAAQRWQSIVPTGLPRVDGNRSACVTFQTASTGGLRLLDLLTGFDRVVLVDAILTGAGSPGETYRLRMSDLEATLHSGSSHDLSLSRAFALARGLGLHVPDDENTVIIAIEIQDVQTFGDQCTPAVAAAIPLAAEAVLAELDAN